jgi:hypothetical protein
MLQMGGIADLVFPLYGELIRLEGKYIKQSPFNHGLKFYTFSSEPQALLREPPNFLGLSFLRNKPAFATRTLRGKRGATGIVA